MVPPLPDPLAVPLDQRRVTCNFRLRDQQGEPSKRAKTDSGQGGTGSLRRTSVPLSLASLTLV